MNEASEQLSFWDHLDVLRAALLKIAAVAVLFSIVAFIFKDKLFEIVLAPKNEEFNTGLAEQFIILMKTALCAGVLCASPYILYQIFRFVSPALYVDERRYALKVAGGGYIMFILGVLISYYLIFPLTFRFLGIYQVSGDVSNMITLQSYISTLILMSLSMGLVFEMPVVCWLFGKLGLLDAQFMRRYRRHAIVIILIVAAIITPTSDIFTLLAVSLPMWALYEVSIYLVRRTAERS